ncbi:disease resistance protein RPM1-like isoform X2 [Camellia sinensis]|uniref:disease resistance protein RPM1-like isoform X2 n=1 Tax=Camellia sinensis TaxID=4442 RepID=UPI0010358B71|nr:disease resistance protein RPM1-like isoform X2 [Camellia sinensis]
MVNYLVGVKIQGGIEGLKELQNLLYVETNHDDGLRLIKELENLRQLRKLGIRKLEREHGSALCAAIEKMKYLKRLSVLASSDDEILDLQHISSSSSPPQYLQRLYLGGRLEKLPDWIPKLKSLVRLSLSGSGLTKNDPLKALQVLPSLVRLWLLDAYDGEELYFEVGRFQKLKQLTLVGLNGLNSVIIEEGALPLLEELMIGPSPQLNEVPSGIHHLTNLKTLEEFVDMLDELINRMEPEPKPKPKPKPNRGKDYWIVEHIISLVSTSGPESEKKCLLLKFALFNNISIGRWKMQGLGKIKMS